AAAIEAYLRKLKYNEQIKAPPPGRDGVDYFLFDSQEGYCDYYASAFVVLARAVGIPARIAAGYSLGDYEPEIEAYRIREYDAHSWPEVYFPRYGWVEFEPTAADPLIVRPRPPDEGPKSETDRGPREEDVDRNLPEDEEQFGADSELGPGVALPLGPRWGPRHWLAVTLLSLSLTGATVLWSLWKRGLQGLSLVEKSYERMSRYARLLGIKSQPSQTPYEYAADLIIAVPRGEADIFLITDSYVRERFSGREISQEGREEIESAWRRLRSTIWWRLVEKAIYFVAGEKSAEEERGAEPPR
ncbi:MAG: DUF4129 domain-containing transglutaminase family protein, partial [Anaerolineae bacterium]